jgi:hypothetical protein
VAYGSVSEKSLHNGKDVSGNYVWMDLLENRNGKWVVVRSAGAKVDKQVLNPVTDRRSDVSSGDCSHTYRGGHLLARM